MTYVNAVTIEKLKGAEELLAKSEIDHQNLIKAEREANVLLKMENA